MGLKLFKFLSLLLVVLALAPAMAHLLELPNKMTLSRDEYFIVQQIYRGWALLGVVVIGALLSTLTLAVMVRHDRKVFAMWEYSHATGAVLYLFALVMLLLSVLSTDQRGTH